MVGVNTLKPLGLVSYPNNYQGLKFLLLKMMVATAALKPKLVLSVPPPYHTIMTPHLVMMSHHQMKAMLFLTMH